MKISFLFVALITMLLSDFTFTQDTTLIVSNTGNVGIRTTNPTNLLHIGPGTSSILSSRINAVIASNTTDAGIGISQQNGVNLLLQSAGVGGYIGTTSNHPLVLRTNDQDRLVILTNGRVGIGGITPDQLLTVNGNASKVGGGSWATFSDQRLKQDIHTFCDGLSVLKAIRPVTFRYNGKLGYPTDKSYVGVIAQEIQSVAPYTIDKFRAKLNDEDIEESDILQFDGSALIFIAINAIIELDARLEELKRIQIENQNLVAKLDKIEALVKSYIIDKKRSENNFITDLR